MWAWLVTSLANSNQLYLQILSSPWRLEVSWELQLFNHVWSFWWPVVILQLPRGSQTLVLREHKVYPSQSGDLKDFLEWEWRNFVPRCCPCGNIPLCTYTNRHGLYSIYTQAMWYSLPSWLLGRESVLGVTVLKAVHNWSMMQVFVHITYPNVEGKIKYSIKYKK